jgi:actin-like ATPase involved in cell morphogenesis
MSAAATVAYSPDARSDVAAGGSVEYGLGVDLGTTYTAAAVRINGHVEVAQLGSRRAEIPSLVFVRADGTVLIGEAAERRGATEPGRLAREFKRRVGDPVPILVGGAPYSAHALMARMLRDVLDTVTRQQEGAPAAITLTHPANWGPYKRELLDQAVRLAELDRVVLRSEPEAAAVQYAAGERVRSGEIVAVYDLGGGTFDAAVLRKTEGGFELLGEPEGIEQLGGIDFDEAVFAHVLDTLSEAVGRLDPDDGAVTEALARLRRDCVEAKEALSADAEVLISVALPNLHTRVRLNRSEFEAMIGPALAETVAAMRRALRSAGVAPAQLRSVLLAGGSSRIPLVRQLIAAEFGRPVVLDPHPEHSIALGAALVTRPVTPTVTAATATAVESPAVPPTVDRPTVEPATTYPPAPPSPRRNRMVLAAVAGAAVLLIMIGVVSVLSRGAPNQPGTTTEAARWKRVADLPVALEAAAVAAFNDKLWVAGGLRNDENRSKLTSVYVYDPATGSWAGGPPLPRPISHASLVATPWGLYFLGGWVQDGGSRQVLRLNDTQDAWVEDVPLPGTRVAGAAAFDGTGLVFGGGTRADGTAANEVWALRNGAWIQVGTLRHGRQKLAAVGNGVDSVLFLGGRDQQTGSKVGDIDRVSQGRLTAADTGVDPPVDSAAAVRNDRIGICLVGGQTATGFADWWCDQPGRAARLPKLDPPRAGAGAASIGGTVYVVGGYGKAFDGTNRVEAFTPPA